jgi:hypothetical protein
MYAVYVRNAQTYSKIHKTYIKLINRASSAPNTHRHRHQDRDGDGMHLSFLRMQQKNVVPNRRAFNMLITAFSRMSGKIWCVYGSFVLLL